MSVEDEVLRIHKKLSKMTSSGTVNIDRNLRKCQKNLSAVAEIKAFYAKNVVFFAG